MRGGGLGLFSIFPKTVPTLPEESTGLFDVFVRDIGDWAALKVVARLSAPYGLEVRLLPNPAADALGDRCVVHSFERRGSCRTDLLVDPPLQRLGGVREDQRVSLPKPLDNLARRGVGECGLRAHRVEDIIVLVEELERMRLVGRAG